MERRLFDVEKTPVSARDPPKKMRVTLVGYAWNNQGVFLHLTLLEHYLGIFPRISLGTLSESNILGISHGNVPLMGMFHEYFTDIHLPGELYYKDKDTILKTEAAQIFFKIGVLKFRNVHTKTLVLESLFNKF